ncbi:MAG: hypothetical protein JSV96_00365 [Candidatus Aminicenantes bacterium]|nr:MAG: hypothetical protein JSV96_00365 [Candidatus Aminicenantes bacterium]
MITGKWFCSFTRYIVILVHLCLQSCTIFAQEKSFSWYEMGLLMEASQLDTADYPIFKDYLDKFGQEPTNYVIEKCKKHQIVILGEIHHRIENLSFFKKIIPEVYHKANVRYVILEVPLFTHNDKLETLVTGESYDEKLAWEIIHSEGFSDWGDKEYWEILETVWSLNQSLPKGSEPMQIVGLEIPYDFKLYKLWAKNKLDDKTLIAKAESQHPLLLKRDELMAAVLDQYVINKKKKGIVLIGAAHAYTHYIQPISNTWDRHYAMPCGSEDNDQVKFWPRMGNILYQQHGNKIFNIQFHYPSFNPKHRIKNYEYKGDDPVISNVIEEIMFGRGNSPVGFDVFDSPFGLLRDSQSYEYHFQPSVKFSDICKGYIFLKPWKDMTFSTWLEGFISDELYNNNRTYRLYYDKLYHREWKNADEIDNWYKQEWQKHNR